MMESSKKEKNLKNTLVAAFKDVAVMPVRLLTGVYKKQKERFEESEIGAIAAAGIVGTGLGLSALVGGGVGFLVSSSGLEGAAIGGTLSAYFMSVAVATIQAHNTNPDKDYDRKLLFPNLSKLSQS